ncbi:MAG: NADH-quinone oxidoreductase subunit L, partial [bacterium]|nr:NADH-quinone oxidoreductase subunit L [bacterium]
MPLDILLIPVLPLLAFVIQAFFGRRLPRGGDWVPLGAIAIAFLLSLRLFLQAFFASDPHFRLDLERWVWLDLGVAQISVGLLVDNITTIMLMVVTVVSSLVHLYSTEYMHGDPRYSRFFGFLAIFSFSMLGLVLVDNFLLLYVFWELVGLSSYLLIGFWYEKPSAASACKKAFLANRVGDLGFFVGIMILFWKLGALDFDSVYLGVAQGHLDGWLLTAAGLCLFCGAVGKSAQFPLHVWLPDAMEGPTPVSALIHAATMVAAGVYMVTRMFPILTPDALVVIAYIGAITAILGATIAVAQNDIKRVLAYSTISQLGYMIMGLGVGAYVAGFFHLVTHAAFKACLFLGSGSVIHAMHHVYHHSDEDPQDMRNMGGLRKAMPKTFWTFTLATLALAGAPLTSGFLSKDAILAGALGFGFFAHPQHLLLPLLGFAAAGLTAYYMFRLIFMTFYGEPKEKKVVEEAHESPWTMTVPLIVLSSLSLWFFYSPNPFGEGWFHQLVQKPESAVQSSLHHAQALSVSWQAEVLAASGAHDDPAHQAHYPAMALSILVAGLGIFIAYRRYYNRRAEMIAHESAQLERSWLYRALYNKWYIDEIYEATFLAFVLKARMVLAWFDSRIVDGLVNLSALLTRGFSYLSGMFDKWVVDGMVNGVAGVIIRAGGNLRRVQTGRLQTYVVLVMAGIL